MNWAGLVAGRTERTVITIVVSGSMECKEASAEFRVITYLLHSPRTSKSCKVVTLATMSPLVFSSKLRWSGEHYFGY